jgi:hypothetical protein
MELSGKTLSLISRLPDFYRSDTAGSLLTELMMVWGQAIEHAEIDLFRVMRSHHVGTASNEGSQGFNTNQQGDLDRLFALYLEILGGTSLLTQVDPEFRPGSFKDLSGLVQKLQAGADLLSRYIKRGFFSEHHDDFLKNLIFPLTDSQRLQLQKILIEVLNRCLGDCDFYARNRGAFAVNTLSVVTRRLIEQAPQSGRDLACLNRALLEAAYPNEIEASDAPYRDRLLALIRVLRRGAATKQGICDIVAANLGIFADDLVAQAAKKQIQVEEAKKQIQIVEEAKKQIQVEEYLPELISRSCCIHPFSPEAYPPHNIPLSHPQSFTITNPNVLPTAPGYKLQVRDARQSHQGSSTTLLPLINPCFVNLDKPEQVFKLEVVLKINDVLRIQPDGTLLLNGVEQPVKAPPPPLPLDTSHWCIKAKVGEPEGQFDKTLFDLSRYDRAQNEPLPLNRQQAVNYELDLTIELTKITPGAFRVRIPWDIPGFTDRFSERQDHPRTQIAAIIDKVKAAGVKVEIVYERSWTEIHSLDDTQPSLKSRNSP